MSAISYDEALDRVLQSVPLTHPILASVTDPVHGVYLAEPLIAALDSPAFTNSAVDGYGFRAESAPGTLRLRGQIAAGDLAGSPLGPGEAVRVLTGAPVPDGVTAVAMQEDCRPQPDCVEVPAVRPGANLRRQGEEYRAGAPLLEAGTPVTPAVVGLIATNGLAKFPVRRLPRVHIVVTGTELASPGAPLTPGRIYESNGPALAAAVRAIGGEVASVRVDDNPDRLREVLAQGLETSDVLLTTGGVSVGDRDLVKETLEELGVQRVFWRVNMKPGKPVYFGTAGPKCVFGLPGNPVAALVTFQVLVRPALLRAAGAPSESQLLPATLTTALRKRPDRTEFVRARLENRERRLYVTPTEGQGAHMTGGIATANALIHLPAGSGDRVTGDLVDVSPLRWATP